MKTKQLLLLLLLIGCSSGPVFSQRPMEYLNRSIVPLETKNGIYLTWRMLGTDPADVAFNLYRNGEKINENPIDGASNYTDASGSVTDKYSVETIVNGEAVEISGEFEAWAQQDPLENYASKGKLAFKRIPLPAPPVLEGATFSAGDMSVGDLDGDGQYELIFEWESSTLKNSFLEAIDLEGNSLWRINAGPNTSAVKLGFMVYDLDEDGKAEVACKTGPGTVDGTGAFLSTGPAAEDNDQQLVLRSSSGHLQVDPAYLTVFDGATGKELKTVDYFPAIGPIGEQDATWGDGRGYRASSIKSAVLYHKDLGPMLVFGRGIYTRIAMAAFTWNGQDLTQVWTFDTKDNPDYKAYEGMGNHGVCVGDVDGDGSDELIYGACAIDHDGNGLYTTGRGHGDSHALGDLIPDRPGLEFFQPHENSTYGISMRDAATGEIIWEGLDSGDVGRAWAADVDSRYPGAEISAIGMGNYDSKGRLLETTYNAYCQPLYFDGDVQKELRNGNTVDNITDGKGNRILTAYYYGASTIHSTKKDMNLVADIVGDWREEIVIRDAESTQLFIFSSWFPTERKNYTLMHDPAYRMQVATQNIGYNQPANVSYYFPEPAPVPNIYTIKYDPDDSVPTSSDEIDKARNELVVFPNPAKDFVTISVSASSPKTVELYSAMGTKISSTESSDRLIEVNLKGLAPGMYVLRICSDGTMQAVTVIKN
ncbi:T9SS type A sorting domain-containing protein [Mangrovibacterium marinum]|uniref:Rhamnogalacturonan endolyase n=1 Tax=Mangrovibacterium marinum TaxID=1639118 RepID=A0A2T5BXP4_9BACT|nr:T9SS type A sorting domain-containing protein [Mangrovibacterium marinum]PTN05920.1 rhamnogalacturonan endolyase [Mangrovibacterium marinum]